MTRQPRLLQTPAVLETEHWQAILVAISAIGAMAYRQARGLAVPIGSTAPVQFGVDGGGDVVATFRGWGIQIETKRRNGKHLETQKRFRAAWERAGGVYLLVRERTPQAAAAVAVAALQGLPERRATAVMSHPNPPPQEGRAC